MNMSVKNELFIVSDNYRKISLPELSMFEIISCVAKHLEKDMMAEELIASLVMGKRAPWLNISRKTYLTPKTMESCC